MFIIFYNKIYLAILLYLSTTINIESTTPLLLRVAEKSIIKSIDIFFYRPCTSERDGLDRDLA